MYIIWTICSGDPDCCTTIFATSKPEFTLHIIDITTYAIRAYHH